LKEAMSCKNSDSMFLRKLRKEREVNCLLWTGAVPDLSNLRLYPSGSPVYCAFA
jgi:hypothetical protein